MKQMMMPWGTMAYDDSGGPGPALVMLHGTGCDSQDWEGVIRELPKDIRLLPLDFRGHGESSTPVAPFTFEDLAADTLTLAERLGMTSYFIVGHSLGGMAAMAVAERSNAVAGLILLEGWTSGAVYGAFPESHNYGNLDTAAVSRIKDKLGRVVGKIDPEIWTNFSRTVRGHDGYPFLQRAKIPIQEVYGDAGRKTETESLLRIPPNPNIQTIWITGAGHYLPHEKPHAVARICVAALPL